MNLINLNVKKFFGWLFIIVINYCLFFFCIYILSAILLVNEITPNIKLISEYQRNYYVIGLRKIWHSRSECIDFSDNGEEDLIDIQIPLHYGSNLISIYGLPEDNSIGNIMSSLENNILVHTHTNGDEATELALDCLERALAKFPKNDHRFTLQHCQLASTAQFKRMHKLGMCANLFSNHHFYQWFSDTKHISKVEAGGRSLDMFFPDFCLGDFASVGGQGPKMTGFLKFWRHIFAPNSRQSAGIALKTSPIESSQFSTSKL